MSIGSLLFFGLIAVVLVYGVMLYNGLVTLKHGVAKAWANIDVLLKRLGANVPRAMNESEAMQAFRHLLSQKIGEMALTVRLRQEERAEVVNFVMTSNVGLEQMRAFQLQGDALLAQADAVVAANRAELYRLLNVSRFGLAAGVLAAFFAFFLYVNQTRTLRETDARQKQLLEAERDALESQVRERTARLTELATYLQQAVEDERAHLARELHDELGAMLTAAKLNVARIKSKLPKDADELAERLKHLTETLNQGIALKRRIIEVLHPSALTQLGLVQALEILCRETGERLGTAVHADLQDVRLDKLAERSQVLGRLLELEAATNQQILVLGQSTLAPARDHQQMKIAKCTAGIAIGQNHFDNMQASASWKTVPSTDQDAKRVRVIPIVKDACHHHHIGVGGPVTKEVSCKPRDLLTSRVYRAGLLNHFWPIQHSQIKSGIPSQQHIGQITQAATGINHSLSAHQTQSSWNA